MISWLFKKLQAFDIRVGLSYILITLQSSSRFRPECKLTIMTVQTIRCHRACSQSVNHGPKAVSDRDSDPFLIWKPDFTLCERKSLSNQAFEMQKKKGILDCDPPRKPDSEDMWTQSSFRTWFVLVHFGNVRWNHAWVSQRSRNKILPHSAQILFVIGTAVAMLVNARSSNHEPNQEADRDPKRLSERDSLLCEQAHRLMSYYP